MANATKCIIQWNCRGFEANRQELDMLVQKYNPYIICLQETLIKGDNKLSFKYYKNYDKAGTIDAEGRYHGGVAVLVKESIPQSDIKLTTNLQAIAARVTLNSPVTICSIYIPPSHPINIRY